MYRYICNCRIGNQTIDIDENVFLQKVKIELVKMSLDGKIKQYLFNQLS